jgi:hypothetical protein
VWIFIEAGGATWPRRRDSVEIGNAAAPCRGGPVAREIASALDCVAARAVDGAVIAGNPASERPFCCYLFFSRLLNRGIV